MNKGICSVVICSALVSSMVYGLRVGSDALSTRQNRTFFPAAQTDNEIFGFAIIENGFTLQSAATTCSFDAFFPVAGNICLNGGSWYLERDLVFKNPMLIGAGAIYGQGYSLSFPNNVSNFSLVSEGHEKLLTLLDAKNVADNVNSVDWSFDDQFVAMVSESGAGVQELQVYAFDGNVLTLRAAYDFGPQDAYCIRWHPTAYVFAVGQNGDTELKLFTFDPGTDQLTLSDSADAGRVQALDWNATGDYLAIGRYDNAYLLVYRVQDAILHEFYTAFFGDTRSVSYNALDWYPTDSFIAVGLDKYVGSPDVQVYQFDGSNLTFHAGVETGQNVFAVSWYPDGSMLAAGLDQGDQRLRMYSFAQTSTVLSVISSAYVNESRAVFGLDWDSQGEYLAEVKNEDDGSHEVRVFYLNKDDLVLQLVSGYEANKNVRAVRWSHSDLFLATGDIGDLLSVFCFKTAPLIFNNAKLFFNSDVTIGSPIIFQGDCVLNMSSNNLILTASGSIGIAAGATLTIEHAQIKGLSGANIHCANSDSTIVLRDVEFQLDDDFTFSSGTLRCKDDVTFSGEYIFAYQSNQPFSIASKATAWCDFGFTFSYDPLAAGPDRIQFADETSRLALNGATLHATMTGLQLMGGKLLIARDSNVSSEKGISFADTLVDNGITVGNGDASYDMVCDILGGVTLNVIQGSLRYKNVLPSSLNTNKSRSIFLSLLSGTSLYVHQNIHAGDAIIRFDSSTQLARVAGKSVVSPIDTSGNIKYSTI